MEKEFIKVDDWVSEVTSEYVTFINKIFIVPFDSIFNSSVLGDLNNFIVKKDNYSKQLPFITKYINYFIHFYDDDRELLLAYLKIKALMDNKKVNMDIPTFIKTAYGILMTESIQEKIRKMVQDNYYTDLTSSTSENKVYADVLQFNNDHGRSLMEISTAMKIVCPVLFHFYNIKKIDKSEEFIFRFYEPLFKTFGREYDLFRKLWSTVSSKINKNIATNNRIWIQREIFGISPDEIQDQFLKDKLISENMFRYAFSGNVVSFNSTILKNQLRYFLDETYPYDMVALTPEKDSEGLSKLDKFEISNTIIDESIGILARPSIKKTIKRLKKKIQVEITDSEIEFYTRYHKINPFQSELVLYYFVKYFGGYRDLHMLNRKQYITLLILLKKFLQYRGQIFLPQLLTANLSGKMNNRLIQNMKFISKIESSSIYKNIREDKYSILSSFDKNVSFIKPLSTIINSSFTIVDYDLPDLIGEPLTINDDILSDEVLQFISMV